MNLTTACDEIALYQRELQRVNQTERAAIIAKKMTPEINASIANYRKDGNACIKYLGEFLSVHTPANEGKYQPVGVIVPI